MNFNDSQFIKSAVKPADFINDGLPQIVFAGRSNVGKSSVINRLTKKKNFARVGKVPGKTAHINYFLIGGTAYFADLPGYGYAKVSKAEKERWGRLMENYFAESGLISAGVLIVDSRHKPTGDDVTMAGWFKQTGKPMIVVANKTDKAKRSELGDSMDRIRTVLDMDGRDVLIPFSAEKGTGCEELKEAIAGVAT